MSMCSPQSNEQKSRVREIFSQVPIYKQKIAGKSIPLEKFSVLKARKCLQHGWLTSLAGLVRIEQVAYKKLNAALVKFCKRAVL